MTNNYAIDMGFSFKSKEEEPININNLPALIKAARDRLDEIERHQLIEAFEVYDVHEEDE